MRRIPAVVTFLAALLVVAACVPDTSPDREACLRPTIELQLELGDDRLEPGSPSVCRDQEVTLLVASEQDGVLHIHGYDSEVPAFEVRADETREITFTAGRSGQFPIEFHALDDPVGVSVGVFTVHEP
jgi:hypothetical protein